MIDTVALKEKVLELAFSGKLGKSCDTKNTGRNLYEEIQKEKLCLVKEGLVKSIECLPKITEDEKYFQIPNNWAWVRWGDLSYSIQYGYNAPAKDSGTIKMVRISDIQNGKVNWNSVPYCDIQKKDMETYLLRKNDILFARTGGTVGKSYLVDDVPEEAIYAGYLIRTRYSELLYPNYLYFFMNSPLYWKQLRKGTTTTAQPNCNGKTLSKMVLPLPPYKEQVCIANSLSEVFTILDKIEKLQDEYTFNLNVLKNKVIDAGVQGKLTEQLLEDGNAEDLYDEIQKEKSKLIEKGKIKKKKNKSEITDDEIPFEIPDNWKWVRLGDLSSKISSGNTPAGGKKAKVYVEQGYCFFREQNIYNDGIHEEGLVYITEELLNTRVNSTVLPKDILLNITGGSIGRCALIPDDFTKGSVNQHILIIRMVDPRLRFFVHSYLCSPQGQKYIKGNSVGDKDGFSATRCKNMPIPLPPLEEQDRIDNKIYDFLRLI